MPLLLLAAFLIAVLIRTFLLQAFYIPSGSMEHTLDVGDKVLVNKVVYDVRDPVRGEIVVFRGTDRWAPEHQEPPTGFGGRIGRTLGDLVGFGQPGEKDFIKRVIAVSGDTVACCDAGGRVTVNGHPLRESYIFEDALDDVPPSATECRSREFKPVTVPPGHIFVLGDHRIVSQDSRCQGPVPIENVIGRAFLVVWPAGRWDVLEVPDTFGDVPKPYAAGATGSRYRPDGAGVTSLVPGDARSAACCQAVRIRQQRRLAW
ncbi:MAG TPA: signal peptidase I [Micromonosporaceae bacterium]